MQIQKFLKYASILFGLIGIMLLFRVVPHPPNFTPIIALSLYLPILFGLWSIPFIILGFAITDFFIGFHSLLIWTWSSLAIIGFISKFCKNIFSRLIMSFISSLIFFIISNFGVWATGSFYELNLQGLIYCYIMAIPFFTNTLLSTILFACLFEILLKSKTIFLTKTSTTSI